MGDNGAVRSCGSVVKLTQQHYGNKLNKCFVYFSCVKFEISTNDNIMFGCYLWLVSFSFYPCHYFFSAFFHCLIFLTNVCCVYVVCSIKQNLIK